MTYNSSKTGAQVDAAVDKADTALQPTDFTNTPAEIDAGIDKTQAAGTTVLGTGNTPIQPNATNLILDSGTAWVGTVSQSGASSIIERGSNANGEYVKFADGTLIMRHQFSGIDVTTAVGSLFKSADVDWTFPIPALSGGSLNFHTTYAHSNTNAAWATINPGQTLVRVNLLSTASITGRLLFLAAIGRWF